MTPRTAIEVVSFCGWAALAMPGCVARTARVPPHLEGLGGVIVSNSPTRIEQREPRLKQGRIEIVYSLIVENIGQDRVDLDFGASTVTVAGTNGSVACDVHGQRMPALGFLFPSNRWRVDCRLLISPEAVQRGDTEAWFEIPVQRGEEREAFRFAVIGLRVEDAS